MNDRSLLRRRIFMLTAAAVIVAWGGIGLYRGLHRGFTGGLYDPQYVVPGVIPGSAADKAGFKAGGRVISVEGRPVEELGMESRWPRSLEQRIGQAHRFVVERKGQRLTIDLVCEPPFRAAVNSRIKFALFGLAFLCLGLWAFFTTGTAPQLILANVGLAAGVATATGLGLDDGIDQDTIEATIVESDVILVVLQEGVHGVLRSGC